jgi:FtsP/CotA-like multicopper oxidase with cupredoxin domain
MDGVSGLNQPPIPVGKTFVYEFEVTAYAYLSPTNCLNTPACIGMASVCPMAWTACRA